MNDFPVAVEVFHSAFNDGFRKVADVAIIEDYFTADQACELAYVYTNSVTDVWWNNIGVVPSKSVKESNGARSTSVGDYLKVTWMNRRQSFHRVSSVGFDSVELSDKIDYESYSDDGRDIKIETMTLQELQKKYAS